MRVGSRFTRQLDDVRPIGSAWRSPRGSAWLPRRVWRAYAREPRADQLEGGATGTLASEARGQLEAFGLRHGLALATGFGLPLGLALAAGFGRVQFEARGLVRGRPPGARRWAGVRR